MSVLDPRYRVDGWNWGLIGTLFFDALVWLAFGWWLLRRFA